MNACTDHLWNQSLSSEANAWKTVSHQTQGQSHGMCFPSPLLSIQVTLGRSSHFVGHGFPIRNRGTTHSASRIPQQELCQASPPGIPTVHPVTSMGRTEAKSRDLDKILTWNTHISHCVSSSFPFFINQKINYPEKSLLHQKPK